MKFKTLEHVLSTLAVMALLLGAMVMFQGQEEVNSQVPHAIQPYVQWEFADLNDPFQKALFLDLLNQYHPGDEIENRKTTIMLDRYRQNELLSSLQGSQYSEKLDGKKITALMWMYLKFLLVYVIVMALTYYGVQTLAVWRFVREKRSAGAILTSKQRMQALPLVILKKLGSAAGSMILFSPAYIIAYAMRTEFNTDMLIFVVLLATISNGLLAMYSTKFYTFLTAESRKGYVDTAIVKNLDNSYLAGAESGISTGAIFGFRKRFDSHVFGHIFKNAQHQYLDTLKEQAAFLITGLIIIEMALNIHGHLSYEMLKQILYKNNDIVITILLMIFLTVKATEFFTDLLIYIKNKKYENRVEPKRGTGS